MPAKFETNAPSQRQLKVGEEIRHALADIFLRGEAVDVEAPLLPPITVSEVRISPDLKNATAYVMPLAGEQRERVVASLNRIAHEMRFLVAKRVRLRHAPRIVFRLDQSYDEASRIHTLLLSPKVAQDVMQD